jgi:hypothetical protein
MLTICRSISKQCPWWLRILLLPLAWVFVAVEACIEVTEDMLFPSLYEREENYNEKL